MVVRSNTKKATNKGKKPTAKPKAVYKPTPGVTDRLLALSEPTKALNARLPVSILERMENYLRATPGGLVHGSKTALVQGVLTNFLDEQGY